MRNIRAIVGRELRSYFNSPIAYVVIIFFLVFVSVWFFFIQQFFVQDRASLRDFFGVFPTVFVLLIPATTMRSWAEERKLGTDELLLTFPIKDVELVLGKYLAGVALLVIILSLTVAIPVSVAPFGSFDAGPIISEYLGVLLLGCAELALGVFLSAVSTNQITAFLLTAFCLLVLTFVGEVPKFLHMPDWVAVAVNYLSIDYHFDSFRKGLLDSRDIAYFVLMAFVFVYSNVKVLVLAKWK